MLKKTSFIALIVCVIFSVDVYALTSQKNYDNSDNKINKIALFAMLFGYEVSRRISEWPVRVHVLVYFSSTNKNATSKALESHPNNIIPHNRYSARDTECCVYNMDAPTEFVHQQTKVFLKGTLNNFA